MSEPIREAIPTSEDRRSVRPLKKRALSPTSKQSAEIEALFQHPERAISPASALSRQKHLSSVPEIVANVQGSSAGAGSGEFHVYKASRRREYERLRAMDEEKEKEESDAKFEAEREEARRRDAEKTEKNRLKREKAKMRKGKKGGGGGDGGGDTEGVDGNIAKAKLKPNLSGAKGLNGGAVKDDGAEGVSNPEEIGIVINDED